MEFTSVRVRRSSCESTRIFARAEAVWLGARAHATTVGDVDVEVEARCV